MRTHFIAIAALVGAGTFSLNAQTPQTPTPQTPQQQQQRPAEPRTGDATQRAGQAGNMQTVTLTGCLKKEADVAGLTPNPAERVGVTDDYILTEAKMAQDSKVSGLAVGSMYELEGITEAELQKHINHQVEVTGTIQGTATASDRTPGFKATGLKMVSASCPAAK